MTLASNLGRCAKISGNDSFFPDSGERAEGEMWLAGNIRRRWTGPVVEKQKISASPMLFFVYMQRYNGLSAETQWSCPLVN